MFFVKETNHMLSRIKGRNAYKVLSLAKWTPSTSSTILPLVVTIYLNIFVKRMQLIRKIKNSINIFLNIKIL